LVSTFSPEGLIEIRWFIGYFQFVSSCHVVIFQNKLRAVAFLSVTLSRVQRWRRL